MDQSVCRLPCLDSDQEEKSDSDDDTNTEAYPDFRPRPKKPRKFKSGLLTTPGALPVIRQTRIQTGTLAVKGEPFGEVPSQCKLGSPGLVTNYTMGKDDSRTLRDRLKADDSRTLRDRCKMDSSVTSSEHHRQKLKTKTHRPDENVGDCKYTGCGWSSSCIQQASTPSEDIIPAKSFGQPQSSVNDHLYQYYARYVDK